MAEGRIGRIVWILGAGFSRSLGGPLLGNLLTPETEKLIGLWYPANEWPELFGEFVDAARRLYWYGFQPATGKDELRKHWHEACSENLWQDAEQYLDYLDTAARFDCPARSRILEILRSRVAALPQEKATLQQLSAVGRRLLAAECCSFLEGVANRSEQWAPYRRWFEKGLFVWGEDTAITFNYDLVPEMIADAIKQRDLFHYNEKSDRTSLLLKLHGSVNWTLEQPNSVNTRSGVHAALNCASQQLAIAGPGPGKQTLSNGLFKPYWDLALDAIKNADAIVFVGYRFPPTDAEARERLLDAIRDNGQQYLAIHTVLGPNAQSDDSRRLFSLIRHALLGGNRRRCPAGQKPEYQPQKCYNIEQQPMWAEDFFSIVRREMVLDLPEYTTVVP
jgi:hypothetical protein